MKVKDLINELSKLDPEKAVILCIDTEATLYGGTPDELYVVDYKEGVMIADETISSEVEKRWHENN